MTATAKGEWPLIVVNAKDGEISVTGHAGYAEAGKDIVCAAVSAITQNFTNSVEQLTTDKLKCVISAGNVVIQYRNLSDKSQTLLDSFFIGIRSIADGYPEHVKIVQACNTLKGKE